MNKSARPLRSRLVRLNRQLSKVVEFRNPQDEESTGSKFAKGAAAVGGVAAAYGGAAYLRGRLSQKPGDWNFRQNQPGLKGVLANIGAGHRANVADMRTAIGGARGAVAPVIDKARAAVAAAGPAASAAKTAVSGAASSAGQQILAKTRLLRGRMPRLPFGK